MLVGEGEVGSDVADPGVLEVAGWRGGRELEDMAVTAKPGLAHVPQEGIVVDKAAPEGTT